MQAAAAGRVFVTRDARLAARRDGVAAFLLTSSDPVHQLGELARRFDIRCAMAWHARQVRPLLCIASMFMQPWHARQLHPFILYHL